MYVGDQEKCCFFIVKYEIELFSEMDCFLFIVGICLISIDLTHQLTNGNKYPSYSLQNMPKTAFSCRGKILGGYYADADTQCQMFHICVKIAGVGVSCMKLSIIQIQWTLFTEQYYCTVEADPRSYAID